jgi:hypothetical protein
MALKDLLGRSILASSPAVEHDLWCPLFNIGLETFASSSTFEFTSSPWDCGVCLLFFRLGCDSGVPFGAPSRTSLLRTMGVFSSFIAIDDIGSFKFIISISMGKRGLLDAYAFIRKAGQLSGEHHPSSE